MNDKTITFEQPLNEHIRVCLRLEHLFNYLHHNLQDQSSWGSRSVMTTLLEILNVIDRPDLKTKLAKALANHAVALNHLERSPQVNIQKLNEVLEELDTLIDSLHATQGKIGHALRENEFIKTIRQHSTNPGGACNFSTPTYYLWLEQPPQQRQLDLGVWLAELDQLHRIVQLLLQLTRNGSNSVWHVAEQGFYQQALDTKIDCQMIRVTIPQHPENHPQVYPEISVGRHRLSIYFHIPDFQDFSRSQKTPGNIEFKLTCCMV